MFKKLSVSFLILTVLMAGLTACSGQKEEIATMVPTETTQETSSLSGSKIKSIKVSTIDEFLDALNSNAVIELADGNYQLDQAADYGKDSDNPAYYWEDMGDCYQLVLNHLHDLIIVGSNRELVSLLTSPRYVNVLRLDGCKRIHMEGFTLGHTKEGELCTGGVIELSGCQSIDFRSIGLFGCGIWGLNINLSSDIQIDQCHIYDCSVSGIFAEGSKEIKITNSDFYTLGKPQDPAMSVCTLNACQNVMIDNCSISENTVMQLLDFTNSSEINLSNTEFRANKIIAHGFMFSDSQPVFDHVSLKGNDLRRWYENNSMMAVNPQNELIGSDQLPPVTVISPENLPEQTEIQVSTADEFLAAIGPNRKIILDTPVIDLSTAKEYGAGSSPFYYWEESYDGPGLIIADLDNFSIIAEGEDIEECRILSVPRYANVISFRNCRNIHLSGFTVGHSEAPGECSGGVLDFRDSSQIKIERCGLFGCGILGVQAQFCSGICVKQCDIYDCSFGGIQMWNTDKIQIRENSFRNLGDIRVALQDCESIQCDIPFNDYPEG